MVQKVKITKEKLTELLKEAEKAHAEYEKKELDGGRDEGWPEWYADYVIKRLDEED